VHDASLVRAARRARARALEVSDGGRGERRRAGAPPGPYMAALMPRVCVVTAGHMATCPRMLKAADALHDAGFAVRVVSASHTPWAVEADRKLRSTRRWRWDVVDYARTTARGRQMFTGARRRIAHALTVRFGPSRVPAAFFVRSYSRAHDELVRAVTAEPTDLVYGGTTGALAAAGEAARRLGVPYG